MENFIIIAAVAVVVALAVRASVKHFRGEGGCCGGGAYKADTKTFRVEGMHCQNCVNRVMEAVNSLEGVSGTVRLKQGRLTVSADHAIDEGAIRRAVEQAGYTVL